MNMPNMGQADTLYHTDAMLALVYKPYVNSVRLIKCEKLHLEHSREMPLPDLVMEHLP